MGDDFDLFPKRENLDPFSFKTKEKKPGTEEEPEELFGAEEQSSQQPVPDAPVEKPAENQPPPADNRSLDPLPPPEPTVEPVVQPEALPTLEPEGPISESKTFDEPEDEILPVPAEKGTRKRKGASPFVVVGGALIIIIGILYLALTFLKKDKPPIPAIPVPRASVPVQSQPSAPIPVPRAPISSPKPAKPDQVEPGKSPVVAAPASAAAETGMNEQQGPAAAPAVKEPVAEEPVEKPEPAVAEVQGVSEKGLYSVQTGAFILESSVEDLEKRLADLGYKSFRKEGSTTAMMNMLTVGPFSSVESARKAVSDLTAAGIESNLVRRTGGGAVINAGSYLLDENAKMIEQKIRNMGYPVSLAKKEARLPMTFVRTGRFDGMSEAARLRDELKEKGLDAIVVKLQ